MEQPGYNKVAVLTTVNSDYLLYWELQELVSNFFLPNLEKKSQLHRDDFIILQWFTLVHNEIQAFHTLFTAATHNLRK